MMTEQKSTLEFERLFARHHLRVYAYVRALVPNSHDADEIIQNAWALLWERFEEYEPGSDFGAWAVAVAFNQIRSHRNRQQRDRLRFSDLMLEKLTAVDQRLAAETDDHQAALQGCLEGLKTRDRELVARYYSPSTSAKSVGKEFQMPVTTVYKTIDRIRKRLFDCIQRRMAHDRDRSTRPRPGNDL